MKDKIIGIGTVILFSPLIIVVLLFALPILMGEFLYSRYRKEPNPKIPKTVDIDDIPVRELGYKCLTFITSQLVDIEYKVEESKDCYRILSAMQDSKTVALNFDTVFDIDIAELNTYEWFIDENNREIDLYLWIAVAVLRGGVMRARSRLGRMSYWVWSDELSVWVVLQKDGTSYDGIHFYEVPPVHIKTQFSNSL